MGTRQALLVIGFSCLLVLMGGVKNRAAQKAQEVRTDQAKKNEIYDSEAKLGLQPAHALWKRYDPGSAKHAFRASSVAQARQWQKKVRPALNELLGFQDEPKVDPDPKLLEEVDKGDYTRAKWLIRTSRYSVMPVYILLPKKLPRPLPVVIAFHGHGYGVKSIVGIRKDGSERDEPEGYQKDFAIALCRRGFAVAAPEISCFGEKLTVFSHIDSESGQKPPSTCKHTAVLASHLGGSVLGLRVLEMKRLIDYLQGREDVDVSRLGVMGISGGGMLTFFTTALDERVKACVISGYFCTFRDSILGVSHCQCNYVHGLGQFGEMSDLVGLIAPRPMLVEAGSLDPIFPIESVKTSVDRAKEVYEVFTAKPQVETDYFEGKHQISGRQAYDFLWEKLANEADSRRGQPQPVSSDSQKTLTPAQGWALGASAVLMERNHSQHDTLKPDKVTERSIDKVKKLLDEWWGVKGREDLLEDLAWIHASGHRLNFSQVGYYVTHLTEAEYKQLQEAYKDQEETLQQLRIARRYYDELGEKSLLGWDYSRYICLCRWGYQAGYIDQQEAWDLILPVAQMLQKVFDSWEDLGRNYLIGRQFWSYKYTQENGYLYDDAYQRLIDMPSSPWNKYSWDLDLEQGKPVTEPNGTLVMESVISGDYSG